METKIELLIDHFGTQRSKDWFDAETFRGLARLRGMECRAPDGSRKEFVSRKMRLATSPNVRSIGALTVGCRS